MSTGPVMLDIEGQSLTAQDRQLLAHSAVGGVILFSRNFSDALQLQALVAEIHALRRPRLMVGVDHEGGRVQRFRHDFTQLPPVRHLGEIHDRRPALARELARETGWLMAAELRSLGVDLSFAPVLDLDRGISEVIGDRAFHRDPDVVSSLAHSYMSGMHEAGMAATGKHFPGHGGVAADSHTAMPVDQRDLQDLLLSDLVPFERMARYGLAAVMPAHVIYPRVDEAPAGFSSRWLREILRGRLGFQGVIFSDDLNMAAAGAGGDYAQRARAAVAAGCDMVLICNNRPAAIEVINALADFDDPVAASRRARMHGKGRYGVEELRADPRWERAVRRVTAYGRGDSLELEI